MNGTIECRMTILVLSRFLSYALCTFFSLSLIINRDVKEEKCIRQLPCVQQTPSHDANLALCFAMRFK
jgi:hypothetical protein